ncbi:peroxisomal membrane protein pex16 [Blastomyces dermatitidis ATCC 18188]|uniref:Peroxisomal membrane protein pex16 n=1 Tax=Ajellomyces dermatitidis (strain ATCC 18188 / CBS 674.68) TaxID=653446 RepID=F2TE55_AJEDA|nr:peroxisomal membrane protein pex16 [Blastomyces dermatitidis ATCC 18188]
MEGGDFSNLAEQVGGLINQCRQWKQENVELATKLEEHAKQIKVLETENSDLQRQLEAIETTDTDSVDEVEKRLLENRQQYAPHSVIHDLGGTAEKPETISYEHYASLAKRYEQLFQENASLIESFFTVKKKLRSCKSKVNLWNKCFERDTFDVYVHGKKTVFRRDNTVAAHRPVRHHRPGQNEAVSTSGISTLGSPGQIRQPHMHENGLVEENTAIGTLEKAREPQLPTLPSPNTRAGSVTGESLQQHSSELSSSDIMSTQTQDPRYAVEPHIFPSSPPAETPIFVSSRPVKGRGRGNQRPVLNNAAGLHETGSFTTPVTVKSEPTSSSPLERTHRTNNNSDIEGDSDDDCLDLSTREKGKFDFIPRDHADSPPAQQSDNRFPAFDERENVRIKPPNLDQRPLAGTKRRLALQPVNANVPSIQQGDGHTPNQGAKQRRYEPRGVEPVHLVAEDGEEASCQRANTGLHTGKLHTISKIEISKSPAAGRLEDLLEGAPRPQPILASPFRNPEVSDNSPLGTPSKISARSITPRTARPQGIEKRARSGRQPPPPTSRSLRSSAGPHQPRADDEVAPEDEPFRARPLHRLGFEHFKLNPERNQGLDYAFDEVVRRKDLRKCLPGCIRPQCCGKGFRAMAKLKGFGTAGNNDVSLEDLDQEDRQVLDEYLGDNRNVLETMTEKELRELLLDARTRHLANQFGKHRHVHERWRSPPGFWRTDMPSTQELERDREEARMAEQEKLAERYKEAMRPGGLWKFADE